MKENYGNGGLNNLDREKWGKEVKLRLLLRTVVKVNKIKNALNY